MVDQLQLNCPRKEIDDIPRPDALDLIRQLDPARHIEIPGVSSADAEKIKRRVYAEVAASHRRSRRLVVAVAVSLLLVAGTVVAVTIGRNLSAVLESEGQGLEDSSVQELRRIEAGDATWTVVRYGTTDGETCVDFELATERVYQGAIGGCGVAALESSIEGGAGGVFDGRELRVLLSGRVSPIVANVTATDDLGRIFTDQPVSRIWAIVPAADASSWIVEAFNESGERIGRIEVTLET